MKLFELILKFAYSILLGLIFAIPVFVFGVFMAFGGLSSFLFENIKSFWEKELNRIW